MNERIKQLADQANANELSYAYYRGEKKPENAVTLHSVDLEMFAELIVRECMLQCIKVENDVELSDYEGGFKDGALLCYQEIQEHFGVEEE